MAHVAMEESSGDPAAPNPKGTGLGLWQINPVAHGKGDWTDPLVNAKKAVELYKQSGLTPWEDSRHQGSGGGWDKYATPTPESPHVRSLLDPPQNPMDTPGGIDPHIPQMVHSGLAWLGGHQDAMFILHNAQLRDGSQHSLLDLLKDPHSNVSQAFALWKKDPGQAMDEYGLGSPAQNAYMAEHFPNTPEGQFSDWMNHHAKTNALTTFFEEMFNPMAMAEGLGAGAILGRVAKTSAVAGTAQKAAKAVGLGSPFSELSARGGVEATQWAKGLIATFKQEDQAARKMMLSVFDGLAPDEQNEVVRLSQGLKPDARYFKKSGDLTRRATALRADIKHVTEQQQMVGRLKPDQTYNVERYFPMSRAYDFGDHFELIQDLRTPGAKPGGGGTESRPKVFDNFDQSRASGKLDADFSAPLAYETWRRQRMQHVAFEKGVARSPSSMTLPSTPASRKALAAGGGKIAGKDYVRAAEIVPFVNQVLKSPQMRRSLIAPELWRFFSENGQFAKYVAGGSQLPGEEGSFAGRLVSAFRNSIVSNFFFHPAVNIAGNDAAARGLYNLGHLGGSFEATALPWETGGYAYNTAKALALQVGLAKPDKFIGGAQQYADWMDRALLKGGIAVFGAPKKSMMGADAARLLTEPIRGIGPSAWAKRLDKAMTRFSTWNMERTFGDKGEAAFSVSLFKDAVTQGKMSDYQAGELVREALGDYYNLDPKSPWSSAFLFMPWLKGNIKFWTSMLVKRPQYVTAPAHAVRDYNLQQGDPSMTGPFAPPDFRVYLGDHGQKPNWIPDYLTPSFVGRDVAKMVEGATSPNEALYQTENVLEGRANPFTRMAFDLVHTGDAMRSGKDVRGPETDYRMVTNPKAPVHEQFAQLGRYMVGHFVPVPLASYALQDAMRKGFAPKDVVKALITAAGVGYGSEVLDEDQRRAQSQAQKRFLKAYYASQDPEADPSDLETAWGDYMQALRDANILH